MSRLCHNVLCLCRDLHLLQENDLIPITYDFSHFQVISVSIVGFSISDGAYQLFCPCVHQHFFEDEFSSFNLLLQTNLSKNVFSLIDSKREDDTFAWHLWK